MAEFKRCDVCLKESPDKNGLFIANHWSDVEVTDCRGLRVERVFTYLVCDDCRDNGIILSRKGVRDKCPPNESREN